MFTDKPGTNDGDMTVMFDGRALLLEELGQILLEKAKIGLQLRRLCRLKRLTLGEATSGTWSKRRRIQGS